MNDAKDRLQRVITSVPLDRTAAMVTRPGEHYVPRRQVTQRHWDTPPPMLCGQFIGKDFTGRRFGRFQVVGLFPERTGQNERLWVVRCVCGQYETRKGKAIQNPANTDDCCGYCRHLQYLKCHSTWHNTGQDGATG